MTEMTDGMIVVTEETKGIDAIVIAIKGQSMKRKKSSKLAEGQPKVIETMTEVILEVPPEVVN